MNLRGHHLFCTTLFTGHGYSEAFTTRMNATLQALKVGEPFQLCRGADHLCEVCPNRGEHGSCSLGTDNALERDAAAFSVLYFQPGESITWQVALQKILQLGEQEFQAVCGGCRWQNEGLCSLALLQKQAKQYLEQTN